MAHTTLTVDGHTLLDGDLTHWQQRPPEQLAELIASVQTSKQPWLKAAMLPLVEAFAHSQDVTITIATRARGWTVTVDHPYD